MSVLQVYTEPKRLSDDQRAALADSLTQAVVDVEVGIDSAMVRPGIMVLFNETPKDRWAVGGSFDDTHVSSGGRILIYADVMEGMWTQERRDDFLTRCAEAVCASLDLEPSDLGTCWVIFRQIDEGAWGAMGGPLSIARLLPLFSEERQRDARKALANRPTR